MKMIRGAARAAAVLTAVTAAAVGMTGTAAAATAYTFSNTTMTQTSSTVTCPSWVASVVSAQAFCLAITVTGTAANGRTLTSNATVALQLDGNRAVRRATFTNGTSTSPQYTFTGTWDSSNGSADYRQLVAGGTHAVALKITVPPPGATATEIWSGKVVFP